VNGRVLHFYLAGINNQNFLMRDKETGTWWQQITGRAIYGPLKGTSLELVLSDELTFGEWKTEVPDGKVLAEVPKYVKEYDSNWEPEVAKLPVVISFPGTELKSRDVVVGLEMAGPGRAYPWDTLVKQSPVVDHVNGTPLLVAVGPDGKSFRVFISRIDGKDAEFFLKGEAESEPASQLVAQTKPETPAAAKSEPPAESKAAPAPPASPEAKPDPSATPKPAPTPKPWILLDTTTASEWNFQGCAISGPSLGKCLDRVPALKDYWFDWRNYHPDTTIYKR
jgi:cell division septation protein DedD